MTTILRRQAALWASLVSQPGLIGEPRLVLDVSKASGHLLSCPLAPPFIHFPGLDDLVAPSSSKPPIVVKVML